MCDDKAYEVAEEEDLRRLITVAPEQPPLLCGLGNYESMNMVAGETGFFSDHHQYHYSFMNPTATNIETTGGGGGGGGKGGWLLQELGFDYSGSGGGNNNNRWPRQETLSLLEIRSRLDSKFRENNHKASLWNEISRIMGEEFGYQRSGKKCKEKFENLYKYYKKTKEGKGSSSRQDGKHYRFFRQLEAICSTGSTGGDNNNNNNNHHQSNNNTCSSNSIHHHHQTPLTTTFPTTTNQDQDHNNNQSLMSVSNNSPSSSSENNEDLSAMMKQNNNKGVVIRKSSSSSSWRAEVEEIVGSHMRNIMETQDAWMERMLSVVEQREQEMVTKEEEERKKKKKSFEKELHELFWAKERALVQARDAALVEFVRKHNVGVQLHGLQTLKFVEDHNNKNNWEKGIGEIGPYY